MADAHWTIPLSDVTGDDELVEAATAAIRSGWWSTGPRVSDLETRLGDFVGSPHALAVANGTAALHLGLLALGVGEGDEVITPSLTFVAAANTIRHAGAVPVFCDIRGAHDLNLDPLDVAAAITPRTRAILPLHYGGFPCEIESILEIAAQHEIPVIEDAAHAIGATRDGQACGTFGAVGTYSFFSNKNLPIGEGGAIVARDERVAERLRLLRSHGMTTMTWDRHRGHASSYDVVEVGFNYRLDEIRAAMALVQLGRLPAATTRRAELAARYVELLHDVEGITVPFATGDRRDSPAHHLTVAILPEQIDREDVRSAMAKAGVQTSVHYPPVHRFTAYADLPQRPVPRTDALAGRILTLPLYPGLSREQVEFVAAALIEAVRGTSRSSHLLKSDDVSTEP